MSNPNSIIIPGLPKLSPQLSPPLSSGPLSPRTSVTILTVNPPLGPSSGSSTSGSSTVITSPNIRLIPLTPTLTPSLITIPSLSPPPQSLLVVTPASAVSEYVPSKPASPVMHPLTPPLTNLSNLSSVPSVPSVPSISSSILSPRLEVPKVESPGPKILSLNPEVPKNPRADFQAVPKIPTVAFSNPNIEFRDYASAIRKASLENQLLDYGYVPLSRIIVEGHDSVKMVKAINKNGQKVFIIIDADDVYMTILESDISLAHQDNVSVLPYSIKMGAMDCAKLDVCGVAFECDDKVCLLQHDNGGSLEPIETTFSLAASSVKKANSQEIMQVQAGRLSGRELSYPVVKLSEIRADPEAVLENTENVTNRLRNVRYISLQKNLFQTQVLLGKAPLPENLQAQLNQAKKEREEFLDTNNPGLAQKFKNLKLLKIETLANADNLPDQVRLLREQQQKRSQEILAALTQLNDLNHAYADIISTRPLTAKEEGNYRIIQKNLTVHNDYMVSFLLAMDRIRVVNEMLLMAEGELEIINRKMSAGFAKVGQNADD